MKQSNVKGGDGILLAARILIALLFLIFGSQKLFGYSGTVQYMTHVGAPLPALATVIAIIKVCSPPFRSPSSGIPPVQHDPGGMRLFVCLPRDSR